MKMEHGLQPGGKLPIAHTYRTAYGRHFDVASSWKWMLAVHVALVLGGLLLLMMTRVRLAMEDEELETPLVLWFRSAKKKSEGKVVEEKEMEQPATNKKESWCRRVTQCAHSLFAPAPSRDIDTRYRFHADMTQQLAASAKTYASIAVSTDDLDILSPRRNSSSRPALPSLTSLAKTRPGGTRFVSSPGVAKGEAIERRTSRAPSEDKGVHTKEDFLGAVASRQSIAVRVGRREALAKEDVYEKLEGDEMEVYEYLEFVRELLDGLVVKKICQKSGRLVSRTLYITADLKTVFWNSIGAIKRQTQKSSIRAELIESVHKGFHGRASVTVAPERENRCVTVRCSDGKCLALEVKDESMRQRLYAGFSRLAQEQQQSAEGVSVVPEEGTEESKSQQDVELNVERKAT